jgi:hypothetical protein
MESDDVDLPSPPLVIGEPGPAARHMSQRRAVERTVEIETLAALIREVDGDHSLGAAALAERLVDRGVAAPRPR